MRYAVVVVLGIAGLAATATRGSAQTAAPSCHGGQQPRTIAELLFGRDIGHHVGVSEAAWARFVARELTPRFPDGLTVTDTVGQWRDRDNGGVVREPGKHVEIVLPGNDDDDASLGAVVSAYKHAFHQQSVGLIVHTACVSF
jgi:Protein of unknown function (DUF3574)